MINEKELTSNNLQIAQWQQQMISWGWRFKEQTFTDLSGSGDVIVDITRDKDPHAFDDITKTLGWGRFPRYTAWKSAYEYCKQVNDNTKPELCS